MKKLVREPVGAVEGVHFPPPPPSVVASVADIVSDRSVVFLFGETVVVFATGTAMGEAGGLDGFLPVDGVVINESWRGKRF
jgi:hypothetical protein